MLKKVGPYWSFLVFFELNASKLRSLVTLLVSSSHFSTFSLVFVCHVKNVIAFFVDGVVHAPGVSLFLGLASSPYETSTVRLSVSQSVSQ